MRYAIVENNIVTNVVISEVALQNNWIEIDDNVGIGATYDPNTGGFTNPIIEYETVVPRSITKRQAMLQLNKVGLYEPLISMINETENIELKIEFEYTTVFDRNSQFIAAVAQSFNLSDEEVDNLFIEASKL